MEEDRESKFVCRFCNKRYPCGKSLGGHIRSHLIGNSAESDEKLEANAMKNSERNCKDSRFEFGGQSGYGLRENPKKTWRMADSNSPPSQQLQQEQVCKQCGKGFQSLKALCGHMACHSEKERVSKDDLSWVMDSHSDTEAEAPRRPKRAASMRYKRIVVKSSSLANGSSSVSEIDHEQEEVAMCLMMLSRDSGNWVGVSSVAESSDNNSVVLETKSSSTDMKIGRKPVETKKLGKGKLKSGVWDSQTVQFENSDSGYFMNGPPKKANSDVSVDGFLRNDSGSRLGKGLNKVKCKGTEFRKSSSKEKGNNESRIASNPMKYDSRKRLLQGYSSVQVSNNAAGRSKHESGSNKKQRFQDLSCNGDRTLKPKKIKGHECPICHKIYKSGQALGGHKRSHFLGGSEERSNQAPVIKQELSEIPDLLDLNLPAPVEEEANRHSQFMPW